MPDTAPEFPESRPIFPHVDPIELDGRLFHARDIIARLDPLLTPERRLRIDAVVDARSYAVLPVLEGLYDRGNASAVLRSAEALGCAAVDIIDTSEQFKQANRVTQGAEKWLDTTIHASTAAGIQALRARGYRIYATSLENAVPVDTVDFTVPAAIVFGNERDGVSREMLDAADAHVIIPIAGFAQSFNISVAAALLLYHARQDRIRRGCSPGDLSEAEKEVLRAHYYLRSVTSAERILLAR